MPTQYPADPYLVQRGRFVAACTAVMTANRLPMVTIYRPTIKDYPGKWVARLHITLPKNETTRHYMTADSLEAIRNCVPAWMHVIGREPEDDPVIEETWL